MGRLRWAGKGVSDGVGSARGVGGSESKLRDEGQLALLAPDLGGERRWRAARRGLWSVKRRNGWPSR